MIAVLDTNVLVSALLFKGNPFKIINLVKEGRVELCLSAFILEEFEGTLKKKFAFSTQDAREARLDLEMISLLVNPKQKIEAIKRKDSDNRILECAIEAKAAVLVTGNMKDIRPLGRFQGIEILTPREFLEKYFPGI